MEIQPGTFTKYSLTPEELLTGQKLSNLQIAVLKNKEAEIAECILNLEFDTADHLKFVQNDAYLKGQLSLIKFLLDSNEAVVNNF